MSDGLSVIRRVVTDVPDDSPEAAVLTQSLAALDALPRSGPDDAVVARVLARAAAASQLDELAAVRGACGLGPVQQTVEGALLAQSVEALSSLPDRSPQEERVSAVEEEAERATFAAVRAAAGEGALPATPEAEILRQSVSALGSLPAYGPEEAVLSAVLARAAQASEKARVHPVLVAYEEADAPETPEIALLVQSRQALDALPTYAPSGEAVASVLAAASIGVPLSPTRPARRAPDRGARPAAQPRRRTGVWAGFATLAVAVIAAVVFLQPPQNATLEMAEAEATESAPDPAPSLRATPVAEDEEAAGGGTEPLMAAVPEQQILPRRASRGPAADDFVAVAETEPVAADLPPARSFADEAAAPSPPDWDAGEDVRLLSLRLRQLREQNDGIEWDEPSVAFGAAGPNASGAMPGVRAVREGVPAGAVRMRSVPTDTTTRR